jgi:NAD(P)-dependent dehydrogenase (short-subunit alcohol dehydrogenase family)
LSNTDPKNTSARTWLITGCSSGLGRALCERLLESGQRVVCTARKKRSLEELVHHYPGRATALTLDVTKPSAIEITVAAALEKAGPIDILVNNAGYGIVGALEEIDDLTIAKAFNANLYGAYRMIRATLPHMRKRGSGHILNISSMGGFVGGAGFGLYNATKFAMEGMSEALSQEVAPFGIKVTIVEPGPFRTDFRSRSMHSTPEMTEYAETTGRFRKMLWDTDGKQPGDPSRAADAMIAVVRSPSPPLRLPLGDICIAQIEKKLAAVTAEINAWRELSLATSFN